MNNNIMTLRSNVFLKNIFDIQKDVTEQFVAFYQLHLYTTFIFFFNL